MPVSCTLRRGEHIAPAGMVEASRGGCRHKTAENMSRAEFGRLPLVRCISCRTALGRVCPDCGRYY